MTWTPEACAVLARLWPESGTTAEQIARKMTNDFGRKFTKNGVISKASRMGLPLRIGQHFKGNGLPRKNRSQSAPPIGAGSEPAKPCHWVVGDPNGAWSYCGGAVRPKHYFCPEHQSIALQPKEPANAG